MPSKIGGPRQIWTFKVLPPNFEIVLNIQISILLHSLKGFLMYLAGKISRKLSIDYKNDFWWSEILSKISKNAKIAKIRKFRGNVQVITIKIDPYCIIQAV